MDKNLNDKFAKKIAMELAKGFSINAKTSAFGKYIQKTIKKLNSQKLKFVDGAYIEAGVDVPQDVFQSTVNKISPAIPFNEILNSLKQKLFKMGLDNFRDYAPFKDLHLHTYLLNSSSRDPYEVDVIFQVEFDYNLENLIDDTENGDLYEKLWDGGFNRRNLEKNANDYIPVTLIDSVVGNTEMVMSKFGLDYIDYETEIGTSDDGKIIFSLQFMVYFL